MPKVILKVEGMTCSACSNTLEKYLNKQKGVIDASVNLVLAQALIQYEDNISIDTLGKYINESGYKYAGVFDEKLENKKDNTKIYLILLGILMIIIMYITMHDMIGLPIIKFFDMMRRPKSYALTLFILTIPYLIFGFDIIYRGIKNIIHKSPNMDTLVALGVIVSFIYSLVNMIFIFLGHYSLSHNLYFESVCMIILFIKLGRYIDTNSREKTKEAIKELVQVTPSFALVMRNNEEVKVTIDEVKVGDTLIVKPGMRVAVDGEVIKGTAHFDESFISGESLPVKKRVRDKIVAGSINYDGVVLYKADKIGPKSTISEMVHMVIEASNTKMKMSRIADRISAYFVPAIISLALLTFLVYLIIGSSFNNALIHLVTVLLVACPCSLGLATPLAIVVAIGSLAKKGILIKESHVLEEASLVKTIVFDKTGTLTNGNLAISKLYNYSKYSDKELLNIVANIEENSIHPLAKALSKNKINDLKVINYQEFAGVGVTGKIDKKTYLLGNAKIIKDIENEHIKDEEKLEKIGNSIVYIVEDRQIIGLIGIKDVIRSDAKNTIKALKTRGYKIVMLTGDNEETARIISDELGIDEVIASTLPKNKNTYIKMLQEKNEKVMMVGDGINDAPSLTSANVGVSFKSSTDIASNSANVVIVNEKLNNIVVLLDYAKKTLQNIKQNLFWAFFYNILMIPIAMGLFKNICLVINPMIASGSMMLSSLCVVLNALKLRNIEVENGEVSRNRKKYH